MRRNKNKLLIEILFLIIVLILWHILTLKQTSQQKLLFPSFSTIFNTIIHNTGTILKYSIITWYRVLSGLIIGSFIGFILGLILTWSPLLFYIFDPIIEIIRPIPPIALTPFFILWFGLGDLGQLILIALGSFMVVVVNTIVSVNNVSPVYVQAAKSLGAKNFDLYKTIFIPAILPNLQSGIRVSSGTAFGLTIAAEYLGAQGGLGYLIRNARTTLQTEVILLAAIILGIMSLSTDKIIRIIFNHLTIWVPRTERTK